jgi:DNA-binding YbaB/EbfC family protein
MAKDRESKASGMLGQVMKLQQALTQARAELADVTVEASAGRGAVSVVMSGTQECRGVRIDPGLLTEGDVDRLQDLVMLAVNQAIHDSQSLAARKLGPLAGGLGGGG